MPREQIYQRDATTVELDGRRLVSFAGCNYLGLAHDTRVLGAAREAIGRLGLSTSASRETSGNSVEHSELEREVAAFISGEPESGQASVSAGLLLPDGYTANLAAAQALAADHRYAVIDSRAHASIRDAARLAGFEVRMFDHLNPDAAEEVLSALDSAAVVMTDGVFTAGGEIAPLRALREVLRPDDTLLVDDCHGFCVLGRGGRGTCDHSGLGPDRVVITTTLAKGLGCGGGIVVGSPAFIGSICARSAVYICTTPVSPVIAAAGRAALGVLRAEAGRVHRLRTNAELLRTACSEVAGGDAALNDRPNDRVLTPVVAFESPAGLPGAVLSRRLREAGVYVPFMTYPGGPSAEYFRASVTSEHTREQISLLGGALRSVMARSNAGCP